MRRLQRFQIIALIAILMCAAIGMANPGHVSAARTGYRSGSAQPHFNGLFANPIIKIKQVLFNKSGGYLVLWGNNGYLAQDMPSDMVDKLDEFNNDNKEVKFVALTDDGGWIIVWGANGYSSKGLPDSAVTKFSALNDAGNEFKSISFTPKGEWVVLYGANQYDASAGTADEVTQRLDKLINDQRTLKQIIFVDDSTWMILWNQARYEQKGIATAVTDEIKTLYNQGEELTSIGFGPDGTWVILYGNNGVIWSKGVPDKLITKLKNLNKGIEN